MEKSKSHNIDELIGYVQDSVVIKTIIKKSTGAISVMSFDTGKGLAEKTYPVDIFVQIIDGTANFFINNKSNILAKGQGIVLPAHATCFIPPNGCFKMIQIFVKDSYV